MKSKSLLFAMLAGVVALVVTGCAEPDDGKDGADYPGPVPEEFTDADALKGGVAYNEWYVTEADGEGSLDDYGFTIDEDTNGSTDSDFVRCKACHGWDGLGNQGSYANRSGQSTGNATRPDVSPVNVRDAVRLLSIEQLFDAVQGTDGRALNTANGQHPDFTDVLTEDQIWNIVKFMVEEWIRPEELYTLNVHATADSTTPAPPIYTDEAGTVQSPDITYSGIGTVGNAATGDSLWVSLGCSAGGCHGADGKGLGAGAVDGFDGVGQYLRSKPNEAWHKIKFGQPGSAMGSQTTSLSEIQHLYKALTDATAYPN